MFESIILSGKQKKNLKPLSKLFSSLGFSRIKLSRNSLLAEKSLGKNLDGKPQIDYTVVFEKNRIVFSYSVFQEEKRARKFEALKTLSDLLLLCADFYIIDLKPLLDIFSGIILDVEKTMQKEGINLSEKIDRMAEKNSQLSRKYAELVRSSEENARLLLESERRKDELEKKFKSLEGLSDESLKEELFSWIKLHSGYIDIEEFSSSLKIPKKRTEEGINLLIKEGYIKKKG